AQVRRGQLLFRFDDRADRANLEKARAQSLRDRATLSDLERQYRRAQELKAQNFIAQNALDTALSAFEAQRALLAADDAAVQAAAVALSYNEIRAPFDGRAGTVNVVPGTLVQANGALLPLVSIAQIAPIAVSFTVPETELAAVLRATGAGKAEGLSAQVFALGADGHGMTLDGRVTFVDNLVDAATGTIRLKAQFANDTQALWPGQYVRVRVTLRTLKDAIVIPQAAVIQRFEERLIYVVDGAQKARQITVRPRYAFGEQLVVEGVEAGASVVLDGKQNLLPGTPVKTQAVALNPAARASSAGAAK
ncbi:MAG TPA: efflux RND transporter periplasmic adaptor subunit, partial [Burkholderiaceae bacterium]